jgi:hypothetical protein
MTTIKTGSQTVFHLDFISHTASFSLQQHHRRQFSAQRKLRKATHDVHGVG